MQDLWVSLLRWKVFYQHNHTPLLAVALDAYYRNKPMLVPRFYFFFGEPFTGWKGSPLVGGVSGDYTRGCKESHIRLGIRGL